uniref:C-type lectin domain-containing protein n=1 Tax=Latimeria chalumnae TaxID=7897 RepID=H2ZT58_LATCH
MDWMSAEAFCQRLVKGAHLVSVHSQEQNDFLVKLVRANMNSTPRMWIGANDRGTEGRWTWSDGSPFVFTAWSTGEPNDYFRREDCGMLNWSGEYFLQHRGPHAPVSWLQLEHWSEM